MGEKNLSRFFARMENKIGVYIHIPFCKKKCGYCAFVSRAGLNGAEEYFGALVGEIVSGAADYRDYTVKTVYFGGGTPSYVDESYIGRTLDALRENYNIADDAEITIEANPESLSKRKTEYYLRRGINRFSIGAQSFDDNILKGIGRVHQSGDIANCVNTLKNSGVKNINCDIMLGLPGQTLSDVKDTAEKLIDLGIPHISAYGLKVEKGTPLWDTVSGGAALPDDDACADMYDRVCEMLEKYGIKRYEISNFAKAGFECRHNINYWKAGKYRGFGAAAHSYIGNVRFYNTSDIEKYIGGLTAEGKSELSREETEFEYIMLNLRLTKGFSLNEYKDLFGGDFTENYKAQLGKFKQFFEFDGDNVRLTGGAFYVFNGIICEFMT